jgi:ubiquinone biosynthesis protein COQ9
MTNDAVIVARRRLLPALLRHVSFDGWSLRALDHAARDAGIDRRAARDLFPAGMVQALVFFIDESNRRVRSDLESRDLHAVRVRDRVAIGVRRRLEILETHREAVRRGAALLSLPSNAGVALGSLHRTVDAIWGGIGDRSTDFNYYTKRALLSAVYGSTLLYWLDDRSERYVDTWAFLDRRIDDVMRIQKARVRLDEIGRRAARVFPMLASRFRARQEASGGRTSD